MLPAPDPNEFHALQAEVRKQSALRGPAWTASILRPLAARTIARMGLHEMRSVVAMWGGAQKPPPGIYCP